MNTPIKQNRILTHMRHLERLARMLMHLENRENIFPWIRLGALVGSGLITFLAFQYGSIWLGRGMLILSLVAFVIVVLLHQRLNDKIKRCKISLDFVTTQISRMKLDWGNIPIAPGEDPDAHHPFESDLNLTGHRSLQHLLDTATSIGGSTRLKSWLLSSTPDPDVIDKRQRLVGELTLLPGFRNRLSLLSRMRSKEKDVLWDGQPLLDWLEKKITPGSLKNITLLLSILAVINIALFVFHMLSLLPPLWVVSLIIYAGIYLFKYRSFKGLFDEAYDLWNSLDKFSRLLVYLEKYPYPSGTSIERLCASCYQADTKPSQIIRKLSWISSAASMQRNQLLWLPLNTILPWDLFFAYQLERSKAKLHLLLPEWLDTFYELEALNSLANFAYLNPDQQFPKIIPNSELAPEPLLLAQDLGHPLLPDEARVCNDFTLSKQGEIAVITGSNMSGKSTFLRTLGINLRLAYCGSVVVASQLQVVPLRIFTCIQLSDSLTDGISYFYAEVRRLKQLLDALAEESPFPVFFLIDEIFRGTNHRERQEGSAAYIHALTAIKGTGVISTHDLTLADLAETIENIHNYHFCDEVRDGRMAFDYHIRPGASPTTNALKIMKLEGLPV